MIIDSTRLILFDHIFWFKFGWSCWKMHRAEDVDRVACRSCDKNSPSCVYSSSTSVIYHTFLELHHTLKLCILLLNIKYNTISSLHSLLSNLRNNVLQSSFGILSNFPWHYVHWNWRYFLWWYFNISKIYRVEYKNVYRYNSI